IECALEGDAEGAARVATPEMERAVSNEFVCLTMADCYSRLGRNDAALRMLGAAVGLGFINYPSLATGAFFESLRADPEYQALMSRVKPRWEAVMEWARESG
ncbi:MAG: TPR end-of-group domain-containing protein, partial [Acidobacteriota bacterium]